MFRHTGLHKKARRDFLERKDVMLVSRASLAAFAALGSHISAEYSESVELVESARHELMAAAFPYMPKKTEQKDKVQEPDGQTYDQLFDELDRIRAELKANDKDYGTDKPSDAVESDGGKLV